MAGAPPLSQPVWSCGHSHTGQSASPAQACKNQTCQVAFNCLLVLGFSCFFAQLSKKHCSVKKCTEALGDAGLKSFCLVANPVQKHQNLSAIAPSPLSYLYAHRTLNWGAEVRVAFVQDN